MIHIENITIKIGNMFQHLLSTQGGPKDMPEGRRLEYRSNKLVVTLVEHK